MNGFKALQKLSFLFRCGASSWTSYVDWGIDRLKKGEEEDDLDVIMPLEERRVRRRFQEILQSRHFSPA